VLLLVLLGTLVVSQAFLPAFLRLAPRKRDLCVRYKIAPRHTGTSSASTHICSSVIPIRSEGHTPLGANQAPREDFVLDFEHLSSKFRASYETTSRKTLFSRPLPLAATLTVDVFPPCSVLTSFRKSYCDGCHRLFTDFRVL